MAGIDGFHRVVTVDDGKTWYRLKSGEKTSLEVNAEADRELAAQFGNVCESTVEMCSKAIGPQIGAECLSLEQKYNAQVEIYEDRYRALPTDELRRIINDFRSTEVQRAAAANLKQERDIKKGLIAPDKGNY